MEQEIEVKLSKDDIEDILGFIDTAEYKTDTLLTYSQVAQYLNGQSPATTTLVFLGLMGLFIFFLILIRQCFMDLGSEEVYGLAIGQYISALIIFFFKLICDFILTIGTFLWKIFEKICNHFTFVPWIMGTVVLVIIIVGILSINNSNEE